MIEYPKCPECKNIRKCKFYLIKGDHHYICHLRLDKNNIWEAPQKYLEDIEYIKKFK